MVLGREIKVFLRDHQFSTSKFGVNHKQQKASDVKRNTDHFNCVIALFGKQHQHYHIWQE